MSPRPAALALLLALGSCGPGRSGTLPPDVIVIVMDTTRGDRCSVNGYERPTTPSLERFARDAVVYRNAWSPSNWTPPAHASLFTGLRPARHGSEPGAGVFLRGEVRTLAEMLEDEGYATAAFVNNPLLDYDSGVLRGFDLVRRLHEERGETHATTPTATETHWEALEFVLEKRAARKPFLLFLNHMEPHGPYTPPPPMQKGFVGEATDHDLLRRARELRAEDAIGHNFQGRPIAPDVLAVASHLYDAEIASLDDAIGGFLSVLERLDALDDAIVVVTSDHGEYLGEHGLVDHMRGGHRTVLHVPLLIRCPDALAGGRRVDDVVRLEDVLPTVLELCGLPVPDGLDGRTLTGDVPGRVAWATVRPWSAFVGSALGLRKRPQGTRRFPTSRSVVEGRYHFLEHSDGAVELYDISSDPAEANDLASEMPEVVGRLRAYRDQ